MTATSKMKKTPVTLKRPDVKPVLAQNRELQQYFLSDTIAYVVNYANDGGFAIVANDSRISEPLAYSDKGSFSEENQMAEILFLDKIEGYLAQTLKDGSYNKSQNITSAVKHLIIEPQITAFIAPTYPFDRVVSQYYPGCCAGFCNVAAATIISHKLDELTYKGKYYDFPSIIYAYNNNLQLTPTITYGGRLDPNPVSTFTYCYEGSIDAYANLMYDISKAAGTLYNPENNVSYTLPFGVRREIGKMGLSVTEDYGIRDISNVTNLLMNNYLVYMWGEFKDEDGKYPYNSVEGPLLGPIAWVIDGCDVYLNYNNEATSGYVHIVWGVFEIAVGNYSLDILLNDWGLQAADGKELYMDQKGYFGVR